MTSDDIRQTGVGSCVFLSALSGGAYQGIDLAGRISYLGNYWYNVDLYNPAAGKVYHQNVQYNGTIDYGGGKRRDPASADEDEYWTILYQRAYLKMTHTLGVNFTNEDYALSAVTHRAVYNGDWDDPAFVRSQINAGRVVVAGQADDTDQVHDDHAYTVMNVYQSNGTWRIILRNPWGHDVKDAQHDPTGNPDDGLIDMTWSDFQGKNDFDRISIS
jgi:hypothetical protein